MLSTTIKLLRNPQLPIMTQLVLEEGLTRLCDSNWFIINECVDDPTIISGRSGKEHELVNVDLAVK